MKAPLKPWQAEIIAKKEELGLTLLEMADRLDVKEGTVWRWVHGKHKPTFGALKRIRGLQ